MSVVCEPQVTTEHSRETDKTYAGRDDSCSNLADIERIVVSTASISIRVDESRIFPRLGKAPVVEEDITLLELHTWNSKAVGKIS